MTGKTHTIINFVKLVKKCKYYSINKGFWQELLFYLKFTIFKPVLATVFSVDARDWKRYTGSSMMRHRFFTNLDLSGETIRLLEREQIQQMSRVLQLKVGEEIILFNGTGEEVAGRITILRAKEIEIAVSRRQQNTNEPAQRVVLYSAILKRDNFEWVVQKATEVGVAAIVPVVTERTVKRGLSFERLRKIAIEAAEQSGRAVVPEIHEAMDLPRAFAEAENLFGTSIFLDFCDKSLTAEDCRLSSSKNIALFIGPEGGWSETERMLAEEKKFLIRSLGKTTLRAETAAIIASYFATHL